MADILYGAAGDWSSAVNAFNPVDFQNRANNGGILSTASPIDNSTSRHIWARLSFICVTSTWAISAGGHLAFYYLPRAHDGSSYPNSSNGSTASDYPSAHYWAANIGFEAGTLSGIGVSKPFLIPPGVGKFYVVNRTGAALPNSATNMTCKLETFAESVV